MRTWNPPLQSQPHCGYRRFDLMCPHGVILDRIPVADVIQILKVGKLLFEIADYLLIIMLYDIAAVRQLGYHGGGQLLDGA